MPIRHEVHDRAPTLEEGETWHLKTAEDQVCGELTLDTLAEWAETGRILADHEVSRNGKTWVKAASVPELKMDWYATLKSGATHGPVNLLALPDMYRRGIIDATAVLRNKLTNREVPAAAILRGMRDPSKAPRRRPSGRRIKPRIAPSPQPAEAETVGAPDIPKSLPGVRLKGAAPPSLVPSQKDKEAAAAIDATAEKPTAPAPAPPPTVQPEVKRLENEVERLRQELRDNKNRTGELLKQLADETALHEQLRARHAKTVKEMQSGLEEKGRQDAANNRETDNLKKRCATLEAENDRLQKAAADTTEVGKVKQALSGLEAELRDERRKNTRLQAEISEKESAWKARANESEMAQAKLRKETVALREGLDNARVEAERLRREIEALSDKRPAGDVKGVEESGWYLRLDDGSIYGPVSEGELYAWAADCRVGPGQQVSWDRKAWQAVESITALRMQWHVTLIDGTSYGPLNAFAIPHLIREGAVLPDATLTHTEEGAETPLADALVTEAASVKKRAADRINEWRKKGAAVSSFPPISIRDRLPENGKK